MSLDARAFVVRRLAWSAVLVISLAAIVGIVHFGNKFSAVVSGTSHAFWKIACDVSLDPSVERTGGGAYVLDDDWFGYEIRYKDGGVALHGSDLYCIPKAQALAEFDQVLRRLDEADKKGEDSRVIRGYRKWRRVRGPSSDAASLLVAIRQERLDDLKKKQEFELHDFVLQDEARVRERWRQTDWHWLRILFEWGLFTGLALFAAWPWIANGSPLQCGVHLALVPMLFLLPVYLGYATLSFTSMGPSGGILYPHVLVWCRGGTVNAADSWILERLPRFLEPLSAPTGSPLAMSGTGMPGPLSAFIVGVTLVFVALLLRAGVDLWTTGTDPRTLTGRGLLARLVRRPL